MQNYQQQRHALGAEANLTLVCSTEAEANAIFTKLWKTIDTFELTFSRFVVSSELSRVNQAPGEVARITEPFYSVLRQAIEIADASDGLYNPLILPALQKAGYRGSWPQPDMANPDLVYEDRAVATVRDIILTPDTIRLPLNSALDLGGSGKGIMLDSLAEMAAGSVQGYWFSLGGDIINEGTDAYGKPWQVDVADARREGKIIEHVPAANAERTAVATSGVTKRRGVRDGVGWHHIIDPRTLLPARTDLLSVTVRNKSALSAEVWAKCAIILGSREAPSYLLARAVEYALLQTAMPMPEQLIEIP
jgi:thiamine biosynthesis lipoprotein